MSSRRLEFSHVFKSPLTRVWPVVSDTDLLDCVAGLPAITYCDEPQPDGTSRRFASFRKVGMTFAYEEFPFAWIHEQEYDVRRVFSSGILRTFRHRCTARPIDPDDPGQGCVVTTVFEFQTKGLLGGLLGKFLTYLNAVRPYRRLFAMTDQRLMSADTGNGNRDGDDIRASVLPRGDPATDAERRCIEEAIRRLRQEYDSPLVDQLERELIDKPSGELRRMQPLRIARQWNASRRDTLNLFLAATRSGLLNMHWDVMCPHCRCDKESADGLADVREDAFCPACNVHFEVDLDRSLEAVFAPHPKIRVVGDPKYCLGGPGTTPHIYYQRLLQPGESHQLELALPEGRYRLRLSGETKYRWATVSDAGAAKGAVARGEQRIIVRDDGIDGGDLAMTAGVASPLAFANEASRPVLVCLERLEWAADALSAGELVADQRFRDLFSSQILAPGVKLAIGSVTLVFTDLVGSTAMYCKLGDARAFSLVWTHFDILHQVVSQYRGAIVKTIGDAIMAVFARPEDALSAADELHNLVDGFCRDRGHDHPVKLKIGLHEGPAISVTMNNRLDYFGTTVNLAARVESLSQGEDIVVSAATAERAGAVETLQQKGWHPEQIAATAKGFADPIPVLRFRREAVSSTQ